MSEETVEIETDYVPSVKGDSVHRSPARIKVLVGGYGSGKTRCAVEEVKTLLAENPGIEGYVLRKTMPALRDSTLNEFLKYMPPELGDHNKREETFTCVNGSKCMFRGLDEPSKFKSTNVAFIVMDEAEEFTLEDFRTMNARIRQKRANTDNRDPFPLHLIVILNPVDETHWIFKEFVLNKKLYEENGGLELVQFSTYDNIQNLPEGYIDQISVGMTDAEKQRYIDGHWGTITHGKAIYGDVFNPELHLKKWEIHDYHILLRGWDFGFNRPACVFRLKDLLGRKNIDFAMVGEKEHLDVFALKVIQNTEMRYGKNIRIYDYCDPRGFDKSDKGQTSVEILNELNIFPIGERGMRAYVEPGIQVVRKELSTLIVGEPELTINPECGIMRAGFAGRYVRDDDGYPKKDGFYDHPMDADRYTAYMDKSNSAAKEAITARVKRQASKLVNRFTGY